MDLLHTYFSSIKSITLVITIVALSSIYSFAQDRNYIAISSAVFDILQQTDPSFESRVEFRLGKVKLGGHPFSGVMVNTEGAVHIYLGLYYDIQLTDFLFLTPSFAPGLYAKNNSKDLKFALEFQSQIEISFKFVNGARVGVSFNHISNATLGVENPGVESLAVTYVIPIF
ncbi:MAG: acyloxyacyl hydrolase [Bacteroidetes bacterium]|nr:acyloxyacyl hydrolase [Bacteroidota bacterium]